MDNLLEVEDPRGITIFLSTYTWEKHILQKHPDMHIWLGQIGEAIQKPFCCIYLDRFDKDCIVYYSRLPDRTFIRVLVKIEPKGYGTIYTAYRCSGPKMGEKILWMASKPQLT